MKLSVIGAGSFGTALAMLLVNKGNVRFRLNIYTGIHKGNRRR